MTTARGFPGSAPASASLVQAQIAAERALLEIPGQVGEVGASGDHRVRDVEAGGIRPFPVLAQEQLDDRLQSLVSDAGELLFCHELARTGVGADQRQPGG